MVEDETGGLLISAHIGNFEMAGNMLERAENRGQHNNVSMQSMKRSKDYLMCHPPETFNSHAIKEGKFPYL